MMVKFDTRRLKRAWRSRMIERLPAAGSDWRKPQWVEPLLGMAGEIPSEACDVIVGAKSPSALVAGLLGIAKLFLWPACAVLLVLWMAAYALVVLVPVLAPVMAFLGLRKLMTMSRIDPRHEARLNPDNKQRSST